MDLVKMKSINPSHLKGIPTFEGGDLYSAGLFAGGCKFPIMNLTGFIRDDVVANMPVFIGRIFEGVTQPVLTGQEYTYTPPDGLDECASGTIQTDISGCEWLVPAQKEIDWSHAPIPWKETWQRFCNTRGIPARSCPPAFQPFLRDGSMNASGEALTTPFLQYMLKGHGQAYMGWLNRVFLTGDFSQPLEVDGLYTQLENGWSYAPGSATCDGLNTAQVIDWTVATAASTDCDGNSNTGYTGAVIDPGFDVDFWLQPAQPVGGLGFGEFLSAFMDAVEDYAATFGGVDQWELHIPARWANCIKEAVSCFRVCCDSEQDTSETNDRYARLRRSNIIDLYPYQDAQITILETNELDDEIWFGPRIVGGCNTYGVVFDAVGDYFQELDEIYGGFMPGLPGVDLGDDPTIADTATVIADSMEDIAFGTLVEREGLKCINAATTSCPSVIAYHRCMWLKIENVLCTFLQKPVNNPSTPPV